MASNSRCWVLICEGGRRREHYETRERAPRSAPRTDGQSGIRLLLLLLILRGALADVTPVQDCRTAWERVPALRSMPRSWPNARSTKRDDRVTAIHSRSSLGFACQGQAYENRRLEGSHECYPSSL